MTVCIAVWPQFTGTYILVTDQMLSSDVASVDGAMKMATIAPVGQWTAMFAGDATRFPPLMDRVRECLGDVRNTRLSLDSVTAAVEKAYQRIVGELKGLGIVVSATTVRKILREEQLGPGRERTDSSTRSEWDRRAVRPDRSIRVPGLAVDPERQASGARPHRVH
jgi:hypothetical protein